MVNRSQSFLSAEMIGVGLGVKGQFSISFIAGEGLSLSWEAEVEGTGHDHRSGYAG